MVGNVREHEGQERGFEELRVVPVSVHGSGGRRLFLLVECLQSWWNYIFYSSDPLALDLSRYMHYMNL